MTELQPRNIDLYRQLGDRLRDRPAQQERALTSIVEALPTESESHAMLAEVRQQQGRWEDAVVHWQEVARIRALEPTGLLKLAEAQIHLGRWDAATETVEQLEGETWPSRFGDVDQQTRDLRRRIEQRQR